MNFIQFHIGDWETSTRLLSPTEKGIYIDLIMLYYSVERPLMRSECDRIARAYTAEEREAMRYVLERFFTIEGESYRLARCDKEIDIVQQKSEKAKKSAKARWELISKKKTVAKQEEAGKNETMRSHSPSIASSNANAMLTNNQEPIIDSRAFRPESAADESAQIPPSPDPFVSEVLEEMQALEEERPVIPSKPRRAVTHKFAMETLPDDWREFCEQVRPDLNPQTTFTSFRAYFLTGNGSDKLRSDKGWNQSWQTWVKKEKATAQALARRLPSQEVEISSDYF